MDTLTAFGVLTVTAALVFYALEERSAASVLAFAGACLAASVHGFLQGAWPFVVVEIVWSGVALRRWSRRQSDRGRQGARSRGANLTTGSIVPSAVDPLPARPPPVCLSLSCIAT